MERIKPLQILIQWINLMTHGGQMYIQRITISGKIMEIQKMHKPGYHTPINRASRMSPTPDYMAIINDRRAYKQLARLINNNFETNDLFVTLTYTVDARPGTQKQTKEDSEKFLRDFKRLAGKLGVPAKYVGVSNFNWRGVPHHHFIMSGSLCPDDIQQIWTMGRINIKRLDDSGDYTRLADYLLRHTSNQNNRVHAKRYLRSRNLAMPVIIEDAINPDSWRDPPKAPDGYFLLTDSIVTYVNSVTGYPYQYYKCIELI